MSRLSVIAMLTIATAIHAVEAPRLRNTGFEDAFVTVNPQRTPSSSGAIISGHIGEGWSDNSSWAEVVVTYAVGSEDPYRGAASQVVDVTSFTSGAVQFVQPVRFKGGMGLRFSIWLRGRPGQSVQLLLRQADAPWRTYASSIANLAPEWREFRVQGVTPLDENGFLMVLAGEPMRFEMDEARVDDLAAIASDAPPQAGNLVTGGAFTTELVPFGWSARQIGDPERVWNEARLRTDAGGAVGGRSLATEIPAGSSADIRSPVFIPNGNRDHSIAFWMKASVPGGRANISLQNTPIGHHVALTTTWERHVFSGTVPFVDWARLQFQAIAPGNAPMTVWIDGVSVEERASSSPEFVPAAALDVALALDLPGHVVHGDSVATAVIDIAPAPPQGARLALTVEDLLGATITLPPVALPATSLTLPSLPGRPFGMFKLRAVVQDANGTDLSAPVELIWSRLPPPRELTPTDSYFGLHIPVTPSHIAMARAIGVRWIRFHDASMIAKWPVIEVSPGKWNFFDRQVSAAHEAGLAILGMLDGAPSRYASRKREGGYWGVWNVPDLPGGMEAWQDYVRTVVTHYRGRIDHWEVWNEPWGEWWMGAGGTHKGYAELMAAAYKEAKAASSTAVVVGVGTYRGKDWHDRVLAASGTETFDAFSFHDYSDALYGGPVSFAQRQADIFNAAQAAVGTPKPLWNTEGGLIGIGSWYAPQTGGMPARNQVAYIIRYDVTMMAAGVKVSCLYAVHSDPAMGEVECRADEHDRAVKPILAARAVLASLVDGIGMPVRSEPRPGVDCYTYPADRGRVVSVWWSYDGGLHEVAIPAEATVLDALGSPLVIANGTLMLTQEPVYLITPAASPE